MECGYVHDHDLMNRTDARTATKASLILKKFYFSHILDFELKEQPQKPEWIAFWP